MRDARDKGGTGGEEAGTGLSEEGRIRPNPGERRWKMENGKTGDLDGNPGKSNQIRARKWKRLGGRLFPGQATLTWTAVSTPRTSSGGLGQNSGLPLRFIAKAARP